MDDAERIDPADMVALLAAAAHLVEADPGDRADQGEAGGERKEQRQHAIAESQPAEGEADEWVEQAKKDDVGAIGGEIIDAACQGGAQIGEADAADLGGGAVEAGLRPIFLGPRRADTGHRDLGSLPPPLERALNMAGHGHASASS